MINQTDQMLYRLSNLNIQQQLNTYQMSTKEKLQEGSDDSTLYSRLIAVDEKVRTYEGLQTQIERTTAQNNVADSSMASIKKIFENAIQELSKANTATTTAEGIAAISANLSGIKENLYQFANTQVEGQYVFAGSNSTIKPFEKDSNGKVTYVGNNQLRKVAVEEGSYREKGVTGFDMMMYPSATAYKGENLNFNGSDRILDQDGNEWKLNSPTNDTLTKFDSNGVATTETITPITNDGLTPATYTATLPSTDGTKFEAKTSIFDLIDNTINALNKVDSVGNPISDEESKALISKSGTELNKAYDGINIAHAQLGGRNKLFENALDNISSKLTQYDILSQNIGGADMTKVAVEAKALELTYTALYSTINKTSQLSLVNFMN
ncbi:distal flagellar hook-filament junction protein [Arcobacter venerupis]|uniref:Distal flagellar hook-filament junction protein n=1 Tax=Arcobacter venerupis TaxID=1054033 RepID=A0AAE7BBG1_9BACT|nr:flagellar hook-associated protein 3 [Arcobacter venerupis]QKF68046.1 distal flagellar hook-filament junction protein [Arcobacter venerupis]RWS48800.1 flagellar biosynthesis protein FlgL [Arcobacter venerupis]